MPKRPAFLLVFALLFVAASLVAAPKAAKEADTEEIYITDRAIIRDQQTGAIRTPTRQETADLVRTLKTMTRRPPLAKETATSGGGAMVDLQGGYQLTVIARPTPDGGNELLCVSTFDQAAEFFGLRLEKPATEKPAPARRGE